MTLGRQKGQPFVVLLLAGLLFAANASARAEAESPYTLKQTYSGALRYLRVALGYEVVERDPDAAYLLFRYEPGGESKQVVDGSIELVETRTKVRLFVRIPAMPSYHERMLRDGLMKKLADDYGEPPPPRKREEPRPTKPTKEKTDHDSGDPPIEESGTLGPSAGKQWAKSAMALLAHRLDQPFDPTYRRECLPR